MHKKRTMARGCGCFLAVLFLTAGLFGCSGDGREPIRLEENSSGGAMAGSREPERLHMVLSVAEREERAEKAASPADAGNQADHAEFSLDGPEALAAGFEALPAGTVLKEEELDGPGDESLFWQQSIDGEIFSRINGKSYGAGCTVPLEELRYLRVLHYDFSGQIRIGELVCSRSISDDLLSIFWELYKAQYPIEKMLLVDEYGGDDDLSSGDNNTSCFNYRTVAGTSSLSLHAAGLAIDINPLYNPYVTRDAEGNVNCAPENGREYMDRSREFPHKLDGTDLCCRLFREAGFTWGGDWSQKPDYMHFSRGTRPER